jgi:hypothetical protein
MTTTDDQLSADLLTTDNVGAVAADNEQIIEAERENMQEELQGASTNPLTTDALQQASLDTLKSDNLDITEPQPQETEH